MHRCTSTCICNNARSWLCNLEKCEVFLFLLRLTRVFCLRQIENPTTFNYIWVVKQSAPFLLLHNDYRWFAVFMPLPCNGRIRQEVVCCHSNKGRFCSNGHHLRTVTSIGFQGHVANFFLDYQHAVIFSPSILWNLRPNILSTEALEDGNQKHCHGCYSDSKYWCQTSKHMQKYFRTELCWHTELSLSEHDIKICILDIHIYYLS